MISLVGLVLPLLLVALLLVALYWVVNRAVLHALRTHHEELRRDATASGSPPPGS
ncbi:hypothetical protein [Blastococcus sp. SYSU DS0619]